MIFAGQIGLLFALVAIGFGSFASMVGSHRGNRGTLRIGLVSAIAGVVALTFVIVVLAAALVAKDFRFEYVSQYSSRTLPWYYSLSALWVGQAGSLLLWSWMIGIIALMFRFFSARRSETLRDTAFGFMMAYCAFLVATMAFAADPMERNIAPGADGAGLSPLLHHPAMLIHPPVVFLAYALWTVPCALAIAALCRRRPEIDETDASVAQHSPPNQAGMDAEWIGYARPWALLAWTVLGCGILLGASWSYEELGWGGYWAWDPVENGSLIPWLTGTSCIHALMAWQAGGMLKKTSLALTIATFGGCNFATFLTRSGVFSSLHAFSQSPIGWLFLGMMMLLAGGGTLLILGQRQRLLPERSVSSLFTREALVMVSMVALLLLAALTVVGTVSVALSEVVVGRKIVIGPNVYNHALIPIGLVLLATMAAAPLLRWRSPPQAWERRAMAVSAVAATVVSMIVLASGVLHPLALVVCWLAAFALATHIAPACVQTWNRRGSRSIRDWRVVLSTSRRSYAGFVIHLGFVSVVVGVTGSSLGTRANDFVMMPGEEVRWAGRVIRFEGLGEKNLPDKFVAEANLKVTQARGQVYRLRPAQHLHHLQDQWTTEVAIHSTWSGDVYAILHHGEGQEGIRLTLIENPLMRFIWFGGWVVAAGTAFRLCPSVSTARRRVQQNVPAMSRPARTYRQPELATVKS